MSLPLDPTPVEATTPIRSITPSSRTRSFTRLETLEPDADPLSNSLARLMAGAPESTTTSTTSLTEDSDPDDLPLDLPADFDTLPPELITLADGFISSLKKPILPAPLTAPEISELYQQFYASAAAAISTHISHSYLSLASKRPAKRGPAQMLSRAEIAQKKRDRRFLESKRTALEEAVERRVTEGVYDRIWRHRSTDDEARDDSLHSKIAALQLVGVQLAHLGVELSGPEEQAAVDRELAGSVASLMAMNDSQFPLGKLAALKAAHKTIVDCLTTHLASTSADALLPALIYTLLLTTPPLNAVSNLVFTQRFRNTAYMDGEASYCLTNLEAAISFLETVDLATLKISPSTTPTPAPAAQTLTPTVTPANITPANITAANITAAPPHPSPAPRFPTPIDLATTAALTADQHIRGLGTALESSYKFLFERRGVEVPQTLEEARKLVTTPSPTSPSAVPTLTTQPPTPRAMTAPAATAALDPLKSIAGGLGRFANMGMRGFSRHKEEAAIKEEVLSPREEAPSSKEEVKPAESATAIPVPQPEKLCEIHFQERWLQGPAEELRLGEVGELLEEYRRLVAEVRRCARGT